MRKFGSSGFSLVEIMMGLLIAMISTAAIIEIILMTAKSDQSFKAFSEFQETALWTQTILLDDALCSSNLSLLMFAPPAVAAGVNEIYLTKPLQLIGDTSSMVEGGTTRNGVRYNTIVLRRLNAFAANRYGAELVLSAQPEVDSNGGPSTFTRSFLFTVETNGAGAIQNCYMAQDQAQNTSDVCTSLGGTYSGAPPTCLLPQCAFGQYLRSIAPDGTMDCAAIGPDYQTQFLTSLKSVIGSCPAGTAWAGVSGDGQVVCR